MVNRLRVSRRRTALPLYRWGVFALAGSVAGFLILIGMRVQVGSQPSLAPLLTATGATEEELTVWVLFQRLDCVTSRWKIEGWGEAAASDRIRVVAWALDSPEGWPPDMDPVERLDVPFEVRAGPAPILSRALRALGVAATPTALVVDRAGRLRWVVPGSALDTPEDLQNIVLRMEAFDA
ncbi:MAG: hypothetical protein R3223_00660 [Longimicrobiales bacterium]|nr:hypothetical protein [Longimicrobiales bacterium]